MEDALNKSLDDIIKEQRNKKREPTKSKPAGNKKRDQPKKAAPKIAAAKVDKRRSGGGGGGGGFKGERRPRVNVTVSTRGRVGGRGGGGGGRNKGGNGAPKVVDLDRINPELRRAKLEGNVPWSHDMFSGGRPKQHDGKDPRRPSTLGTKLYISNLHFNVTNEDVKELFETCGSLVMHEVHYARSGRSQGIAEVIFQRASDAENAQRRYNNVQLDGQPMHIELVPKREPIVSGAKLTSGIKITGGNLPAGGGSRLFAQATTDAVRVVRGRGSVVRSQVVSDRMQE